MKKPLKIAPIDGMILAFSQLLQPAKADEVFDFAANTQLQKVFDKKEFLERFDKLQKAQFLWRTADDSFVVTPMGASVAALSLKPKERDKFRLLILNKRRYRE